MGTARLVAPGEPGKFVARVTPTLHRQLATNAAAHEVSMNTYIGERLKEIVS